MARLQDLCKSIPTPVLQAQREHAFKQAMCEVVRRKAQGYLQRMECLNKEHKVFDQCKQTRPQKGNYKNRYSREEAGTCGFVTMGVRTGKYSVCVCKVKKDF